TPPMPIQSLRDFGHYRGQLLRREVPIAPLRPIDQLPIGRGELDREFPYGVALSRNRGWVRGQPDRPPASVGVRGQPLRRRLIRYGTILADGAGLHEQPPTFDDL